MIVRQSTGPDKHSTSARVAGRDGNASAIAELALAVQAAGGGSVSTVAIASPGGAVANEDNPTPSERTQGNAQLSDDADAAIPVAAALAFTRLDSVTEAFIATTGTVTASNEVLISADSSIDSSASADASNVTAGDASAVAIAVNVSNVTATAYLGGATLINTPIVSVLVDLPGSRSFTAEAISGAGTITEEEPAGAFAPNLVGSEGRAYIAADADLDLTGADLVLDANNALTAGTSATPGTDESDAVFGTGSSVALTVLNMTTEAVMEENSALQGVANLTIEATSQDTTSTEALGGVEDGGGSTSLVAPAVAVLAGLVETLTEIGGGPAGLLLLGSLSLMSSHTANRLTRPNG